jgi:biopolymer transport protein ExbB
MEQELGFAHFLAHTDGVGKLVLAALLLLSVASWYLIVTRTLANTLAQKRAAAFLAGFWDAPSLQDVSRALAAQPIDNAFAELAQQALQTASDSEAHSPHKLAAAGGLGEFLTRVLRNGIDQEAARHRRVRWRPMSACSVRCGASTMRWCRSACPARARWTRSPVRWARR